MVLTPAEARYFAVDLLKAETARDAQSTIGASNLSNGCDFCLASNLLGDMRDTPVTDRAWGGRVLGTAIHAILEQRMNLALTANAVTDGDDLDEESKSHVGERLRHYGRKYPDAQVERHITLGQLGTYGLVGMTPDLVLPSERQAFDWKGTTKAKNALLQDYMAIARGQEPPYGRQHAVHKAKTLSEKVYAEELRKVKYKVDGYYSQLQTYGGALNRNGIVIEELTIVFISRDDTMWFDNPISDGYDDPKRSHGVSILTFPYNKSHAEAVWNRGLRIWEDLENGATVDDFPRHELCFPCGLDGRNSVVIAEIIEDAPITIGGAKLELVAA